MGAIRFFKRWKSYRNPRTQSPGATARVAINSLKRLCLGIVPSLSEQALSYAVGSQQQHGKAVCKLQDLTLERCPAQTGAVSGTSFPTHYHYS